MTSFHKYYKDYLKKSKEYSAYQRQNIQKKNELNRNLDKALDRAILSYLDYVKLKDKTSDFIERLEIATNKDDLYSLRFLLFLTESLELGDMSGYFIQVLESFNKKSSLNNLALSIVEWIVEYWLEFCNPIVIPHIEKIFLIKPYTSYGHHIKVIALLSRVHTKESFNMLLRYKKEYPIEYVQDEANDTINWLKSEGKWKRHSS